MCGVVYSSYSLEQTWLIEIYFEAFNSFEPIWYLMCSECVANDKNAENGCLKCVSLCLFKTSGVLFWKAAFVQFKCKKYILVSSTTVRSYLAIMARDGNRYYSGCGVELTTWNTDRILDGHGVELTTRSTDCILQRVIV